MGSRMFGKRRIALAVFTQYAATSSLSTIFTGPLFILPTSNAFTTSHISRFSRTINYSNRAMTTTAAAATSSATSKNNDDDTPSVRIVCYNVLSSQLARTDHFSKTPPSHLDASNRLPKVLAKIEEECRIASSKSLPVIFCLQEVSLDWVGEFHAFFAERGYHFVPANYGGKFGGYMGIISYRALRDPKSRYYPIE